MRKATTKPVQKTPKKATAKLVAKASKAAGKKSAAVRKVAARKPATRAAAKAPTKTPAPRPAAKLAPKPIGPQPIPDGFRTVTPYLSIDGAAKAIDYYKADFGAEEIMRLEAPGGLLGHAEIKIGDSMVMLADPWPGQYTKAPTTLGGATASIMLYVPDVDAFMARAVKAGATVTQPPANMFWGDRFGKIRDPFGHEWGLSTHVEDVPPEEMSQRMKEAMKAMAASASAEPDDEPPEAA